MRNRISVAAALAMAFAGGIAHASTPSVADLDAASRSTGNRRAVAQRVGEAIFRISWPAQVTQISANQFGAHLIVGVRISGVKFRRPIARDEFGNEVVSLVTQVFAAAPAAEEIDLWASVPIRVAKGEVVSGDLAKPTSRTVFSLTVKRPESPHAVRARIEGRGDDVFWDAVWSHSAFKQPS